MPKIIHGSGNRHPRVFICGERPGGEEHEAGKGFVGRAGEELWARLWRVCKIERADCWVTNLVKTFSPTLVPPTTAETARDAPLLREELRTIRPTVIAAVGYHAARWFLPQYWPDWPGDYFHGLPHTTIRCRGAVVVPLVHSAAALRQPDRYQQQLTDDCEALRGVLRLVARGGVGAVDVRRVRRLAPYAIGLASIQNAAVAAVTGLDTEGTRADPQAVSLASTAISTSTEGEACCIELQPGDGPTTARLAALRATIAAAPTLAIHHAKWDWQVLARLGIDLAPHRVHDPMLQAYLLGLPQSLKVLAYRELRVAMTEYEELVLPIDTVQVRRALEAAHEKTTATDTHLDTLRRTASDARRRSRTAARHCRAGGLHRAAADVVREHAEKAQARFIRSTQQAEREFPKRARSAIRRLLEKDGQKTLRQRWGQSTFAGLVPLPPAATWRDVSMTERTAYACTDALMHKAVHDALWPRVKAEGLARVYRIDRGVLPFLARNEQIGLRVDVEQLAGLSAQFAQEYTQVCAHINALAGREVNPLAAEDISDTIFHDWGVTPTRRTKTGFHTTQDKYLKARKAEHQGVPLVLDARNINKMRGTYTERLPKLLRDGRYHPNWKYTRTTSGRAAEEIILLIPKHSARGMAIRQCFVADDGCELVSADLSQIELREFAHLTQEPKMLKALRDGVDLHALTAYELLRAPKDKDRQDESLHRLPAKTINFGILMGMTPWGLLDQLHEQGQLHWTLEQVEDFHAAWFTQYATAAAWVQGQKQFAQRYGYVRTREGRVVRLSGVWSTDERIAAEFERKAHAIPVQEGAANIAKRWIARVWANVLGPRLRQGKHYCEPWVWVHDDVTLCVDRRIATDVERELLSLVPQDLCVPVTADVKRGRNWARRSTQNPEGLTA